MSEIAVRPEAAESSYVISVDGVDAGDAQYADVDRTRVFLHTTITPEFEGQGLASQLVAAALTDARAQGMRVVAVCPYVRTWLERHHDFDDIVDPMTQDVRDRLPQPPAPPSPPANG
ncbi:GNAT family N-acetyltransferase [Gryllotalpicola sp.]|uniref:GNAT family N-acetyltransferase n=1 Tax=Gryllotalpicola sp. TaxID=1932787 RepID=UPI00262E4739|nr:GNAT family N-acetyltransferase [Gryllotalpicola sp.]